MAMEEQQEKKLKIVQVFDQFLANVTLAKASQMSELKIKRYSSS
jgi:hypothetical protein